MQPALGLRLSRWLCAAGLVVLGVLGCPGPASAGEASQGEDILEEELESLQEDDFPDLVHADASGDFMDELMFLQDASMVELPARHRQEIGMSPSAVTVLTREDVETSGATSIPDLLRLVPGLEIVTMSHLFPSVTGRLNWNYENNSHLVLVDGRETNVEIMGFSPWAYLPVFLEDIERIEVIRGPGSALYGANALSGVISITTRTADETGASSGFFEAGQWNNLNSWARVSTILDDWKLNMWGGFEQANRWGGDPWSLGKRLAKLRGMAEYALSADTRIRVDGGLATGSGMMPSTSGDVLADPFRIWHLLADYRSDDLTGRLYYTRVYTVGLMEAPLAFAGVDLA